MLFSENLFQGGANLVYMAGFVNLAAYKIAWDLPNLRQKVIDIDDGQLGNHLGEEEEDAEHGDGEDEVVDRGTGGEPEGLGGDMKRIGHWPEEGHAVVGHGVGEEVREVAGGYDEGKDRIERDIVLIDVADHEQGKNQDNQVGDEGMPEATVFEQAVHERPGYGEGSDDDTVFPTTPADAPVEEFGIGSVEIGQEGADDDQRNEKWTQAIAIDGGEYPERVNTDSGV